MNILVAIFNLLPGYPMDGGRVLRSAVWGITGDTKRASRVAYSVGRVVFFLLIGYGALQVFNGDMFGGIWIILIGWFLMSSARSEARGEQERKAAVSTGIGDGLGFSVALATKAIPQIIEADTSVNQALSQGRHTGAMTPIPIGRQGELIGFVVRRELDDVPLTQRNDVSVRQLMNSGSLRVISRGDSVREALRMMDKHQVNQLVVMDDDYVIGIVTREDIVAILVETRSAGEPHNSGDVGTPV
jgi:CBS domain-containing protein